MKRLKCLLIFLAVLTFTVAFVACSADVKTSENGTTEESEVEEAVVDDGQTYELMISTQMAESHGYVQGFYEVADRIEERSGGKFKITVFPSAQLGSDEDVIEQALQGVNVAVVTDAGRMANYSSDIGIMGMAYFGENYDELLKVTKTDFFAEQTDLLAEEGIRVLCFNFFDGDRHFLTNKPINTPEDLNGVRIRTPGAPAWSESVKSLGATPVAMGWCDVYTAMQQKAIDGAEAQHAATYASKVYEVIDYISKTGHFQLINGIIVGEKWFKTIPEEYQTMLIEEFEAIGEEVARKTIANCAEFERLMVEEGVEVIEPDVAAFVKASESAYEVLGYTELREKIYVELGK